MYIAYGTLEAYDVVLLNFNTYVCTYVHEWYSTVQYIHVLTLTLARLAEEGTEGRVQLVECRWMRGREDDKLTCVDSRLTWRVNLDGFVISGEKIYTYLSVTKVNCT